VSTDTLIHRLVRPPMRVLARTSITPNHITTARCITGIAAALGFAQGGQTWPAVGAAIFVLSMLLDRADGELARQSGKSSRFGAAYDIASDCGSNMLAMLGIGIGAFSTIGAWGPILGTIAGLGILALFWLIFGLGLDAPANLNLWGDFTADPDDALLAVPLAIWCGASVPLLIAAAAAAPAASLWLARRARLAATAGARNSRPDEPADRQAAPGD
jgi:archaetidylinositol phosphate synthase